jgi:hypothetical protein
MTVLELQAICKICTTSLSICIHSTSHLPLLFVLHGNPVIILQISQSQKKRLSSVIKNKKIMEYFYTILTLETKKSNVERLIKIT